MEYFHVGPKEDKLTSDTCRARRGASRSVPQVLSLPSLFLFSSSSSAIRDSILPLSPPQPLHFLLLHRTFQTISPVKSEAVLLDLSGPPRAYKQTRPLQLLHSPHRQKSRLSLSNSVQHVPLPPVPHHHQGLRPGLQTQTLSATNH